MFPSTGMSSKKNEPTQTVGVATDGGVETSQEVLGVEDHPEARAERPSERGNMVNTSLMNFRAARPGSQENQLKSLIMAQIERWRHG